MLEKKPFVNYTLEEDKKKEKDIISIRIMPDERLLLNSCKKIIEQPKDSTALKTLAWIGAKVIHGEKEKYIIETLFKNKRNNRRNNVVDFI